MDILDNGVMRFSTGKVINTSYHIIGIDPELKIFSGYDDALFLWEEEKLTSAERKELAEHVIALWQQWANLKP